MATLRNHDSTLARMPRTVAIGCALVLTSLGLATPVTPAMAESARAPEFRLIVHRGNTAASLSRNFVAEAFLKKATRWEDGESIRPVDQRPAAAVRRRFTASVLKRPVTAVRNYWQQRIFSGRDVPPPEFDSDEAVVGYVAAHTGAVGYVSGTTRLVGVREVSLR